MKIFYNANIYAPHLPMATAFAIDHGYFIALGSKQDVLNLGSFSDRKIDLQGKTIWPGLTDAHVHMQHLADSMSIVNCETGSIEKCLARVKAKASLLPQKSWVHGHGWNHNRWENGYGTAAILDKATGEHPAYLTSKSLHAGWANSLALKLAGIDRQTPDPKNGMIQKDNYGIPTGILLEPGAMSLVESVIPKPAQKEITANIKSLIPELWKLGLIGLHDFDSFDCWQALQSLYQTNQLSFRIRKNIHLDHLDAFIQAGLRTDFGDDQLHMGSLKLFADGALGPQTAAMKQPYVGGENRGKLLLTEEEIFAIGRKAIDHGFALSIHAIGDKANEIVLNAFTRLRTYERSNHLTHLPHRIEHVQIIDEKDMDRMHALDIVASIQPVHAPSDMDMADKYLGARAKNAYAYQAMIESGVMFVCGSDAPVEPVNPFFGLHAAVTRRRSNGVPGLEGWHPEQKISLEKALKGFSHNTAVISSRGRHLGKICAGYKADFLILEKDPFSIAPHEIAQIQPSATFIDGNCVYKNPDLDINL